MRENFGNTGRLVRFMLKRERIISATWIVFLVLFCTILAPGLSEMFTVEEREQFASTFGNPVMVAMMGPVYGADNYTPGAMYTGMMLIWIIIAVAIMNIFLVTRHTRTDEESGRAEIVRSLPVGRMACLNATMLTALIVNAIMGFLLGLCIAATGVETMGFADSMLFGVVVCASGLSFASVTALFCQLTPNKGTATGYSFLALGVLYMIRAAGDMQGNDLLSCFSPLGLAQRAQVYIENHWWPVLVLLLFIVGISAVAYYLNSIRDLDQGFIHARPGRNEASPFLRSPFGLAFRILRGMIITWVVAMFCLGASYGSVVGDINSFVGGNPQYLQVLGVPSLLANMMTGVQKEAIVQKYFMAFVAMMMTLVSIAPLLIIALKPRSEEKELRAEHVLARAVPRVKYLSDYTVLAYLASILIPCATAFGIYLAASSLAGDRNPFTLGMLMKANAVYIPALWVMISIAVFLNGLIPRATGAIWGYYGFVCFASFIGEIISLPDAILFLSPIKHVPQVLIVDMEYIPLIVMTLLAALLTAAGFLLYKRREMMTQ